LTWGHIDVEVDTGRGGRLFDRSEHGAKPFDAKTITAFGVGADGRSAWIAGQAVGGHTFLAYAVDNGRDERGHDTLQLWIDGCS
jgi:hypothetical protein